jgi:hypothetical protein
LHVARNRTCIQRGQPMLIAVCWTTNANHWTTNANRCVLSVGVWPSRVSMLMSARCSSKNRITLISSALRSDAQDLTTNPPHNHNTLIVLCTKTPAHRSQKTHKRPHTPPRNQTTYHSHPLAYTYRSINRTAHEKPFNHTNIICDDINTIERNTNTSNTHSCTPP